MSEAKTEKSKSKFKVIDLVYIGLSAALIAVCSWISIPLPTVPITLQTMGVVLIASLFGAKRGVIATVVYILLGAIGVPVFSGFSSGLGVMIICILVCYAFGTAWFAIVYTNKGTPMGVGAILGMCVVPFLIPDAVKIVIAAVLTNRLKRFIK